MAHPTKLQTAKITTNEVSGAYRPMFFDLSLHNLSEVVFESIFFDDENNSIEEHIIRENYSFAYLRENKLRIIRALDAEGKQITANQFLPTVGLQVNGNNLFKSGKYLSRIFRPVKYGEFFTGLNVFINSNYEISLVDGISLISLSLAQSLGWKNVKAGMSAQFTLLGSKGLVKGHCVVSDTIDSDIVIYGENNINKQISFTYPGAYYVSVEPVKLSNNLRLDIQSLLNLWHILGESNLINWANDAINKFKKDLLEGRLSEWFDDFEEITSEEYKNENWVLKKAIWHKVDYRRFPGLFRLAWAMFKNSMETFTSKKGRVNFRIPIIGGKRAYVRIDLRSHDKQGNFTPTVKEGSADIDKYGNLWMHPSDIAEDLKVLGGADQDDNLAIIPAQNNNALIYRSPNQYGEYIIKKIEGNSIHYKLNLETNLKKLDRGNKKQLPNNNLESADENPFVLLVKEQDSPRENFFAFTQSNLIRTFNKINGNHGNIGIAANAEMIRSAIGINDTEMLEYLISKYNWNLERIIDSTVKDGISAEDDMRLVQLMYEEIIDLGLSLPKTLEERLPVNIAKEISFAENHKLDQLFEAVKILINKADIQMIGFGSVKTGKRIEGYIDKLDIPFVQIGKQNMNNPMQDVALKILADYHRDLSINLKTEDVDERKQKIEEAKLRLLRVMKKFSGEERILITRAWAYHIYKSESAVHDTILWIKDMDELRGTAEDTFEMLSFLRQSTFIKHNGSLERTYEARTLDITDKSIRLWAKELKDLSLYENATEILISKDKALIADEILNIGDNYEIEEGIYAIKSIARTRSKRDSSKYLKNSLTVYLQ